MRLRQVDRRLRRALTAYEELRKIEFGPEDAVVRVAAPGVACQTGLATRPASAASGT